METKRPTTEVGDDSKTNGIDRMFLTLAKESLMPGGFMTTERDDSKSGNGKDSYRAECSEFPELAEVEGANYCFVTKAWRNGELFARVYFYSHDEGDSERIVWGKGQEVSE